MLRAKRMERYYDTMAAIAASPKCSEFIVGYTARAGDKRLAEYAYNFGYQHLVIIADRMTRPAAHALEKQLQDWVCWDKRSVVYRKYEAARRGGRYYPSAGQSTSNPMDKIHSVYMAWWQYE